MTLLTSLLEIESLFGSIDNLRNRTGPIRPISKAIE